MASFAAPTDATGTWVSYEPGSARANLLFRHFRARNVGRNVYYLTNGTITENDPDGTAVTWDAVRTVWWGGHLPVEITAAEQAALENAGYTTIP